MSIYSSFLGIPYLHGGRSRAGVDCWGLCVLFYKEVYGIGLPDAKYAEDETAALIAENMHEGFRRVEKPLPGDFVLICNGGDVPNHIGIVINRFQFIHSMQPHGVYTSHLRRWGRRIYGFYRKS